MPDCHEHPIICHHLQRPKSLQCSVYERTGLMDDAKETAPAWVHQDRHHLYSHVAPSSRFWLRRTGANRRRTENTDRIETTACTSIHWHDGEWRPRKECDLVHGWTRTEHIYANTNALSTALGHFTQIWQLLQKWRHVQKHSRSCRQIRKSHTHREILFVPLSKVWLHIVTTVSLLRIRPDTQTVVFRFILVYS